MSSLKSKIHDYLGNRFVLVVEPAKNYRDSLRRFFENLQVKNIKMVSSIEEARTALISIKIGLFVSEWILPAKNGLELCRIVRSKKNFETTPFLLITAEDMKKDVILACEAGVDGYLLKPFSYDEFCAKIGDLINAAQNPSDVNQAVNTAQNLINKNNLLDAEELLNKVLAQHPRSARAIRALGDIAFKANDFIRAQDLYTKAVDANPDYIDAYTALAELYKKTKALQKMVEVIEKVNLLSPDNPRYTLMLAHGYIELGRWDDAETSFKKTLALSPLLAQAHKGLGTVYFEKKEYERAIKHYRKALDILPTDISLLNSLGLSYVKKGLYEDGINYYKLALKIDSFDWRVLFNLAYAFEKLGDTIQAVSFYERALKAEPELEKAERRLKGLGREKRKAS